VPSTSIGATAARNQMASPFSRSQRVPRRSLKPSVAEPPGASSRCAASSGTLASTTPPRQGREAPMAPAGRCKSPHTCRTKRAAFAGRCAGRDHGSWNAADRDPRERHRSACSPETTAPENHQAEGSGGSGRHRTRERVRSGAQNVSSASGFCPGQGSAQPRPLEARKAPADRSVTITSDAPWLGETVLAPSPV